MGAQEGLLASWWALHLSVLFGWGLLYLFGNEKQYKVGDAIGALRTFCICMQLFQLCYMSK